MQDEFGLAKSQEQIIAEINKIVNSLIADGTIASIFAKYNAPYTAPAVK